MANLVSSTDSIPSLTSADPIYPTNPISTPVESDKDLLHFTPLSAHIMRGLQLAHVHLTKMAPGEGWQGRTVKIFAKSLVVAGYIVNLPIALIEFLALGVLGVFGGIIHSLSGKSFNFLERFSIKCMSYCFHSFAVFVIECIAFSKIGTKHPFFPKTFTQAAIVKQFSYVGTAALANNLMFQWFRGIGSPAANERMLQTLREGAPTAIVDIVQAFINDYAPVQLNYVDLQQFFDDLPVEQQELLRNFDVTRIREENYLQQYFPIIINFCMQANIIPTGEFEGADGAIVNNELALNIYSEEEKNYQTHLKDCVKAAYKEMTESKLCKFLSKKEDFNEGLEMLEMYDPTATIPLAHLAQVHELDNSALPCPLKFKHKDLEHYNNPSRRERVLKTKEQWLKTAIADQVLMVERLIKGADFKMGDRSVQNQESWDNLYKEIASLASDIHQGKLMSVLTINLTDQNFSSINYFGKAWQEAAAAAEKDKENEGKQAT